MINEKDVVDDNNVLFFLLYLSCFYIVNIHDVNNHAKYMVYKYPHVKYMVYKYSHANIYTISCNVEKCFSHVKYMVYKYSHANIYILHMLCFVNNP